MDNTPQQPDAEDRYEAVLREHHKAARRLDSDLKDLAEYLRGNLPEVARHLLTAIPQQSEAWRQELGLAIQRGPRASKRPGERRPRESRASEESTAWVMERGVGSRQLTKGTYNLERTAVQRKKSRLEKKARAEGNRCGQRGQRPDLWRPVLHIYPITLHVVLTALVIGACDGPLARSQRIRISEAANEFPRTLLLGSW